MSGNLIRIFCLLSVLPAGTACAPDSPDQRARPETRRVALIGWDGASWPVLRSLVRAGRLPQVEQLLARGSHAVLTPEKPMYSPVLWTSIATGFPPAEHGVTGFQLPDPKTGEPVLASTFHRRRAPLWQAASSQGRTVGFVGWWTTWPAEPVQGYMVSDHLAYNRWGAWAKRPDREGYSLAFPPGLADELAAFARPPGSLDEATLTALVPFNATERREMMAAEGPVMFHAPSVYRYAYATDASNAAFAGHLLDSRGQPDLFGVVFILTDVAGHVFWHHYEPDLYREAGPDVGRLHDAIPNVYAQLDRWTGEILDRLEPDTTVVVLSDHGMAAKGVLPQPGRNPAGDHTEEGVLIVAGPGVPAGADLGVLSSLDIAPTVLALLGLPVARDMPGRVIGSVLGERTLDDVALIDSYGDGRVIDEVESESPAAEEYLERLKSLGYVQ